jgi:hypothetical protein
VTRDDEAFLQPDAIEADDWSARGNRAVWIGPSTCQPPSAVQSVLIGLDVTGALECASTDAFDVLLTSRIDAPAPWISVPANRLAACAQTLAGAVRHHPVAATILARTLRLTEKLAFVQALDVESLAYSTLLGGEEFRNWCAMQPLRVATLPPVAELVRTSRAEDMVTLTLNDPERNNVMTAAMRDALYNALANCLDDPSKPLVLIKGEGRCFSTGGHLPEFGSADDLAQAHVVRTLHSCARALHSLGERASVMLHGACIGSGFEVPAAACHRIATPDAWFQLPELQMGLIPGAGGTVSVSRAIGRHRTAWMLLSGKRVTARQALSMGLIHTIIRR